jgi:proteasome lid subunit RPN8/RPN11
MDYHSEDFLVLGNTNPIKQALRHLLTKSQYESCGIMAFDSTRYEYKYIPLENTNTFDKSQFTLDPHTFNQHYLSQRIIALCHCHHTDSAHPSEADLEMSESLGLPFFIISTVNKSSYLYYPSSYIPPALSNRIFIPMFQDCMIFVKDFYELELKIKLSDYISNWSRSRSDSNKNLLRTLNSYFVKVKDSDFKTGDIMVFRESCSSLFHIGVVDKNSKLYHHPINCYPRLENITPEGLNKVYNIYRYKDL